MKCALLPAALAFLLVWAPEARAQNDLPEEVKALARIRGLMGRSLREAPNYVCRQEIQRQRLTKRDVRRLEKKQGQSGASISQIRVPLESSDKIAVDVAYVDGQELYAWPSSNEFSNVTLGEMVGFGNLSTGLFVSTAHNLFEANSGRFEFVGEEVVDDRRLLRYDFEVGLFQSGYILSDPEGREAEVPYAGAIWADARSGELVALETRAVDIPPYIGIVSVVGRTEYEAVEIDGSRFLLPRMAQEVTRLRAGSENRSRTVFSNCRRFGVSSAISFSASQSPEVQTEAAVFTDVELPLNSTLFVRLASTIDSGDATVGDEIHAILEADINENNSVILPRGATIVGRIRRLEKYVDPFPFFALGIQLLEARAGGRRARFVARMTNVEAQPGIRFADLSSTSSSNYNVLSFGRIPDRIRNLHIESFEDLTLIGVGVIYIEGETFRVYEGLRMVWEVVQTSGKAAGESPAAPE